MAIDDLNIYTRLCEIFIIYIWGGEGYGKKGFVDKNAQKKRDTIKISLS